MTFSRFLWCVSSAMIFLMGCPSVDTSSQAQCDAARRCGPGDVEVCGEDGQTYACAALARCEGVIVDPSAQACMGQSEQEKEALDCQPVACRLYCEEGFETDANGCEICECVEPEEVICPPIEFVECRDSDERRVCDEDDVCGTSCRCEPLGTTCPAPVEPSACPDSARVECGDVDGDGCEECRCEVFECPPQDDGECDVDRVRVCQDRDGDGCEECVCEVVPVCDTVELDCEFGIELDEVGCERCKPRQVCDRNEQCELDELCLDDRGKECCQWGEQCEPCGGSCQAVPTCGRDRPCGANQVCRETVREECCPSFALCADDIPACLNQCINP